MFVAEKVSLGFYLVAGQIIKNRQRQQGKGVPHLAEVMQPLNQISWSFDSFNDTTSQTLLLRRYNRSLQGGFSSSLSLSLSLCEKESHFFVFLSVCALWLPLRSWVWISVLPAALDCKLQVIWISVLIALREVLDYVNQEIIALIKSLQ